MLAAAVADSVVAVVDSAAALVPQAPPLAHPVGPALEPVLARPEPVVQDRAQPLVPALHPQELELPDPAHFLVVLLVPRVPAQVPPGPAVRAQVLVVLAQVVPEPVVLPLLLSRR
jgi:hypothetical protein